MSNDVKYHVLLKGLNAGHALPKPPVSILLGPTGVNLEKFCRHFNEWSKNMEGTIDVGVIIFNDLSYAILPKKQYLDFKKNEMSEILSTSNLYKQFKEKEDKLFHSHR